MEEKLSFCRFCHAFCAIKVSVENGKAVKVIGDKTNPMYFGYTCKKGRALPQQHYHHDRLLRTQKRKDDGSHAAVDVEQAMDEIAEKLQAIIDEHGPRALAMYTGTFSHAYPQATAFAGAFMAAIGCGFNRWTQHIG